jgi:hypothetical protein
MESWICFAVLTSSDCSLIMEVFVQLSPKGVACMSVSLSFTLHLKLHAMVNVCITLQLLDSLVARGSRLRCDSDASVCCLNIRMNSSRTQLIHLVWLLWTMRIQMSQKKLSSTVNSKTSPLFWARLPQWYGTTRSSSLNN